MKSQGVSGDVVISGAAPSVDVSTDVKTDVTAAPASTVPEHGGGGGGFFGFFKPKTETEVTLLFLPLCSQSFHYALLTQHGYPILVKASGRQTPRGGDCAELGKPWCCARDRPTRCVRRSIRVTVNSCLQ